MPFVPVSLSPVTKDMIKTVEEIEAFMAKGKQA